jgi:uncharacterized protein (TIGR02147 family)
MAPPWSPDLYEYLDFRLFFKDYYLAGRAKRKGGFSYRQFTEKIGYSSSAFIPSVIKGTRNLNLERIDEIARGMRMDQEEKQYLELLIRYGQCEDTQRRPLLLEKLLAMQRYHQHARLLQRHVEYLSHWYYPTIREMVTCQGFREDPAWIGERLAPQIPADLVEECLECMLRLKLLGRDEQGALRLGDPSQEFMFTGHEALLAQGSRNYHSQMLMRATDAIYLISREKRHLNALTFAVAREKVPQLKERINAFIETTLAFCEQGEPQEVYQLHVALFPLTQIDRGDP